MKKNQLNPAKENMNRTKHEQKLKHRMKLQEKNLRHVQEFKQARKWNEKMEKRENLCGCSSWLMNTPLEV